MEDDDEKITVDISSMSSMSNTITITGSTDSTWMSVGDITSNTIDISSIIADDTVTFDWDNLTNISFDNVLWKNTLPDLDTVEKMSKEYPALEKAFENFKTVYTLVEQDYKGKQDEDDELPF